jgi:hypothetical protein
VSSTGEKLRGRKALPLAVQLANERNLDFPADDLANESSKLRRVVFRCEPMTTREIVEAAGLEWDRKTDSLAGQALRIMRLLGFHFDRTERRETRMVGDVERAIPIAVYRLRNPKHEPSATDFETMREGTRSKAKRNGTARKATDDEAKAPVSAAIERSKRTGVARKATGSTNGHGVEWGGRALMERLPTLGHEIRVRALVLNDDGSVTMALRDEAGAAWMVGVHGATVETT